MAQQHDCATTNKQTHKLEFYLNIRETTPKRTNLSPRFKKKKNDLLFPPPPYFPWKLPQFTRREFSSTKLFNGHRLRNRQQQLNEIMNYDNVLRSISASLRSAKSRPAINFNVRRTRSNCKANRTRFEMPVRPNSFIVAPRCIHWFVPCRMGNERAPYMHRFIVVVVVGRRSWQKGTKSRR